MTAFLQAIPMEGPWSWTSGGKRLVCNGWKGEDSPPKTHVPFAPGTKTGKIILIVG